MTKNQKNIDSSIKVNAVLNMLKQACSILFPLITFPYASRALGTQAYGKYSFANSIISYFVLIAGLGISTYAIREGARIRDNKKQLETFVNEVFSINVIFTVVSYIGLTLLIFFWNKLHNYFAVIYIESLMIFLNTIGSDWINSIFEDYKYITIRYIIIQLIAIAPIFIFVRQPSNYLNYTLILVLAGYGGNLVNLYYIRRYVHRRFTFKCNFKKHIKPILVLFSTMVAVRIYLNSDITMLGAMTNDHETGIYGAVSKIYTMAKELINAITIVMVPRISNLLQNKDEDEYKHLANSTLLILITFILPITVGLCIFSKDVILIVNGNQYISGFSALVVLSLALPFAVMSCFYSNAILVPNRKEKYYLISTTSAAITNILLNVFFIRLWGIIGAALTTLIAEIVVFLMVRRACFSQSLLKVNLGCNNIASIIIGTAIVGVICVATENFLNGSVIRIIVGIVTSVVLYYFILKVFKNDVIKELKIKSFFK